MLRLKTGKCLNCDALKLDAITMVIPQDRVKYTKAHPFLLFEFERGTLSTVHSVNCTYRKERYFQEHNFLTRKAIKYEKVELNRLKDTLLCQTKDGICFANFKKAWLEEIYFYFLILLEWGKGEHGSFIRIKFHSYFLPTVWHQCWNIHGSKVFVNHSSRQQGVNICETFKGRALGLFLQAWCLDSGRPAADWFDPNFSLHHYMHIKHYKSV